MKKRGPKPKPRIICEKCNKKAQPVREVYCKNCASVLVRNGVLPKILTQETLPKKLTKEQEEVLTGLMLGDGCLYRRKPTHNPYLVVGRSRYDNLYLKENYNIFKDFCKKEPIDGEVFDKRTQKTYYFSKFITRRCSAFTSVYELWYPNGKKYVPKNIKIPPLAAAIWFADDGNIRPSCSSHRMQLQLSTDGFSPSCVNELKKKLENILDEYFFISKDNRIGSSDAGTRKFIEYIDPYFPESMYRKAYWKNKEAKYYEQQPKRINPDAIKHGNYQFNK